MNTAQLDTPFVPTREDMGAIYNGVGVTEFDTGEVIALTADRHDATGAFLAHFKGQGNTSISADDLDISMAFVVFIRHDENDEDAWEVQHAGENEQRPTTVVAWLEA